MRLTGIIWGMGIVFLSVTASIAATKSMKCERYKIGSDNKKTDNSTFSVEADFNASTVRVNLLSTTNEDKTNHFPLPNGLDWSVIWKSSDNMRVVAVIKDFENDNPFALPVMLMDADFAKPAFTYREAGGLIDLELILSTPWEHSCERLN